MRLIDEIIIHCSATKEGIFFDKSDIDRWHRAQGWSGCGYHYVILLDGTLQLGRPISQVGAHCSGHNSHSIGVCYIGGLGSNGLPKNTLTPAQEQSLILLIKHIRSSFPQHISLHGHNEYAKKACPSFNVQVWRAQHGL